MSFTRDWISSWILDHSKFKTQPSYVRGLMDDVGERLAAYLYGFSTGETFTGYKKVTLISIGTGSGDIPTGTGVQAAINLQGKTIDGKVELITIDADGNEIQFTSKGAFLANNAWLTGNLIGTSGNQNILKINTAGGIQMGKYLLLIDTGLEEALAAIGTGPASDYLALPLGYLNQLVNDGIPIPTVAALPTAGTGNAGQLYLLKGSGTAPDGLYISKNVGSSTYGNEKVNPGLGAWVDKSADYGAQVATTDGFVVATINANALSGIVAQGYTDSSADPTTLRAEFYSHNTIQIGVTLTMPVRKGDYWKIVLTGSPTVTALYWIPSGA